MSDEEISEIVEKGPRQRDAARERRAEKKGMNTDGEGAPSVS